MHSTLCGFLQGLHLDYDEYVGLKAHLNFDEAVEFSQTYEDMQEKGKLPLQHKD